MQQLDVFVDADTVVTRPGASGGKAGGGRGGAGGASVVSGARKKQSGDFQSIFAESLGAGASALGESIDDAGMDADGEDGDGVCGGLGKTRGEHVLGGGGACVLVWFGAMGYLNHSCCGYGGSGAAAVVAVAVLVFKRSAFDGDATA
jgi:hypothetical protein